MKRTLLPRMRMVLLLLAYSGGGAILNVAVAWPISFAHQWRKQVSAMASFAPPPPIPVALPSDWQQLHFISEEDRFASRMEQFEDPSKRVLATNFYSGWPLLSLCGIIRTDSTGPHAIPPHVVFIRGRVVYCLPIVPRWPGFAINTIFYAAILWLLFATPGKIRRIIRGRRGQCPACGYPIRGGTSNVCTECGRAVKKKATANGQ